LKNHIVVLLASEEGRRLVRENCQAAGFDIDVFEALVDAELEQVGKQRKAGLWESFDEILVDIGEGGNVPEADIA
jgi:hypothetical protein